MYSNPWLLKAKCVSTKEDGTVVIELNDGCIFHAWEHDGMLHTGIVKKPAWAYDTSLLDRSFEIVERIAEEIFGPRLRAKVWADQCCPD